MKNFRPLVYLAATLGTIGLLTGPVAAETFGTDIRVNDDSTEYGQYIGGEKTSVVLQENTLYAVWQDNRNYSSNYEEFQKADIYFSKSTVAADGMVTPGANILVNDIPGGANRDEESRPAMTVGVDGTIYIVWTDKRNIDNQLELNDIYFSKSTDGGLTFSANQPIGTTSGNSVQSAIAVAGTSVYIIFQHCCDPANDVINLVTSIDSGESFGDIATIVPAGGAEQPEVAAQGSSVYIAYRDRSSEFNGNVMLITSSNNGASFGAAQQLNSDTDASVQTEISLTATGSNVYAIWRDRRDNAMGVYLATSTDNGITFGNDQLVVPHSTDPATYPAISAYGDTLALGYIGNIDDHYGSLVLARLSNDAGATWTEPLVVSDTDVNRPSIGPVAVSTTDEGVCLLWVDDRGGHATGDDIYTDCYYFPSEETEENCGDYNEDGMVNIDDLLEKIKELKEWIKECWLPNLGK